MFLLLLLSSKFNVLSAPAEMWTSLYNFLWNKLFNRPEIGFRRSDDSCCTIYGKRLKLIDNIWNSNGLLNRTNSSCSFFMQKGKKGSTDISDDEEDCRIIAEIPRRKKASHSMTGPRRSEFTQHGKHIQLSKSWSEFSFQTEQLENNVQDKDNKEAKLIKKFSGKEENMKIQPKKFFNTPRVSITQGKLARSRLSYRNQLRKKVNFLQESYRLKEKLQYMQLLRSHTSYRFMTVRQPLKCVKGPDAKVEIIDLSEEETNDIHESTSKKNKKEEQDIQILGEVPGVRSFQDIIKYRPLNVEIALKGISSSHYKSTSDILRLPEGTINLDEEEEIIDDNQKTDALEERLRNFMQIAGPTIEEVENRELHYLPEFTPEQEVKIRNALKSEPREEVLSTGFGLQITRQDMQTLVGLNWLNDEIINYYMNLIMERSKLHRTLPKVYAFNTFFYPKLVSCGYTSLRRWTKQVDIFSYDIIVVPIHLGMHWCLSVIDFRTKSVNYYDSIGSPNDPCLERLLLYLKAESLDKRKKMFTTSDWEKSNVEDIPQQMNGGDCGVFSCMFAEYLTRDCSISFTQDDMPFFRKKMVIEILEKKLLT